MFHVKHSDNLVDYGIHQDKSHYRTHVGVETQALYTYPTEAMKELLKTQNWPVKPVYRDGVLVAQGYLCPVLSRPVIDILNVTRLTDPQWFGHYDIRQTDSTTIKGQKAARLVEAALQRGLLRMPWLTEFIPENDLEVQVAGHDIKAHMFMAMQVKCDWSAGPKQWGGSGNLYLQIRERNMYKEH